MIKEFKEFIAKGNVLDMAVGIVIGLAFGKIITSLVDDVIMPPIGLLLGKVDFSKLVINLPVPPGAEDVMIRYGAFINTIINFLIVAFVIFLIVRSANKAKKDEAPTTKDCPHCLTKIPAAATKCPACTSEL